jgi:hypothetical protein
MDDLLTSGDRSDNEKRLLPRRNLVGQRRIRRFVRQIFLASEETQKRSPLLRDLIPDRPAQHRITSLKRVKHRALRDRTFDFKRDFAAGVGQRSQMLREYHPNHGSVCTSTLSTPGKSRTIGAQLSPASADA